MSRQPDKPSLKHFILALGVIIILMIIAFLVVLQAYQSKQSLEVYGEVIPFQLEDQQGDPFNNGDLRGTISVVNFFFTNCQGVCPRMNGEMKKLYDRFSSDNRVQFVSVSVDPARDNLAALREYAAGFGVTDQQWRFLRGTEEQVAGLSEEGFLLPAGVLPAEHSRKLVLVDEQGKLRGWYDSFDREQMNQLASDIRQLLSRVR